MAKLQKNRDRQSELKSQMLAKRSDCEAQNDLITTHIGDTQCQLLETVDNIKVVSQASPGMSFFGNDCKIILNNYQKLYSVV